MTNRIYEKNYFRLYLFNWIKPALPKNQRIRRGIYRRCRDQHPQIVIRRTRKSSSILFLTRRYLCLFSFAVLFHLTIEGWSYRSSELQPFQAVALFSPLSGTLFQQSRILCSICDLANWHRWTMSMWSCKLSDLITTLQN